ncbi:MAG: hypothetical protein CW691_00975 [Candidatus Bathyarchaeum sp.]|nr:MAG: hypothetical protein CW691_00975 [Candidatus Bathyarchaeum sp.]
MTLKRKYTVCFTALCLLMTLLTFSAFVTVNATGQTNSNNTPPDMPETAFQYNRTDITPSGHIESIQAMELGVFFYRNATLMMNCTQNCEMNITIDEHVQNKIVSINVDPNRTMTLTMNITAFPP